ncbi:hypothetical protein DXG03_008292 [Asterophora parasitica]|uniref:Glycosyl hydrolase family 92 domain-containing protein n=1 Tax=Asterophora parasitica TaxID=117018 RepID=A0A9P7K7Z1_9AGAR|nr:hypothetical protein DXG03_008292 [Asterophora parasitica]
MDCIQPSGWARAGLVPGATQRSELHLKRKFEQRGLCMRKEITPSYYSIVPEDGLESSRPSVITSTPTNVSYPHGSVAIHLQSNRVHETCRSNSERQDTIITPISTLPYVKGFNGYYCGRFDYEDDFEGQTPYGTIQNSITHPGALSGEDTLPTSGAVKRINLARRNIDEEIPEGLASTPEHTAHRVRTVWTEKLDRFALQCGVGSAEGGLLDGSSAFSAVAYYSGYDGKIQSYTGYSTRDRYRTQWAFLILFAPERLSGMNTSTLADYKEFGTHAASHIAEVVIKGIKGLRQGST